MTADHVTPSAACELQARLGADRAMAFDINAACSGFVFALETADAFLGGAIQNRALIGAERLSRIMDWTDRSTCVLFGDGAGRCDAARKRAFWVTIRAATGSGQRSAVREPEKS